MPILLVRTGPGHRLELCSGVIESDEPCFRPGSLVPRADWKPANGAGCVHSWDSFDSGKLLHDNIALIRVLDSEILARNQNQSPSSEQHHWQQLLRTAVEKLEAIGRQLSTDTVAEHKGQWLAKGCGKSLSTTWDRSNGKLTGLHIDRWERKSLDALPLARNRICLNLGPRARWFVFLPIDLQEVAASCGEAPTASITTSHALIYLRKWSQTPVCRLRVEPGEAYIAPTERLIHDGQASSTAGEWVYTMFGRFEKTEEAVKLSAL